MPCLGTKPQHCALAGSSVTLQGCVLTMPVLLCASVCVLRAQLLCDMGMVAASVASLTPPAPDYLSVSLDGKVLGYLPACVADKVVRR